MALGKIVVGIIIVLTILLIIAIILAIIYNNHDDDQTKSLASKATGPLLPTPCSCINDAELSKGIVGPCKILKNQPLYSALIAKTPSNWTNNDRNSAITIFSGQTGVNVSLLQGMSNQILYNLLTKCYLYVQELDYLRLISARYQDWSDREHFIAVSILTREIDPTYNWNGLDNKTLAGLLGATCDTNCGPLYSL